MKITNRYNLPAPLFRAASNDSYSRGASRISVTQLIGPPQITILTERHHDQMVVDVVDRIWTMLGTAMHGVLEQFISQEEISEERLFLTVRGWLISGAVDLQKDGGIIDYKVTGVWSVMKEKPEWERQLNCYAALVRRAKGTKIKRLQICAILRDWHGSEAEHQRDYPQQPVQVVEVPVWSEAEQDAYLEDRVRIHQEAATAAEWGEPLPECSEEERWVRNKIWAVIKKGRRRALKLFDNPEDASKMASEEKDAVVEYRPGEAVRCQKYCGVSAWCDQWLRDKT